MIGVAVFVVFYDVNGVSSVAKRAGKVAGVTVAPTYLTPHFAFGADLFGLSLQDFRTLHKEVGILTTVPVAIHVAAAVRTHHESIWTGIENQFGVAVGYT
jgi:hypothetical protein